MDKYPIVSIIVPCWNGKEYVGEAIQSALDQTYQGVEVIVIDDGSIDGSLDVIKSFAGKIFYESGPNRGACAARNRGIELARGELIQFLDADDLLFPEKLEYQVPILLHEEVDCVTCDRLNIDESGKKKEMHFEVGARSQFSWIVQEEGLRTASALHRKVHLKNVNGFDETLPCAQEYDLHIRLSLSGVRFRHISKSLWVTRERNNSISSDTLKVTLQHPKIFHRAQQIAKEKYQRRELDHILKALSEACLRNARRCIQFRKDTLAEDFILLASEFHHMNGLGFYRYNPLIWFVAKFFGVKVAEKLVAIRRGEANYFVS